MAGQQATRKLSERVTHRQSSMTAARSMTSCHSRLGRPGLPQQILMAACWRIAMLPWLCAGSKWTGVRGLRDRAVNHEPMSGMFDPTR